MNNTTHEMRLAGWKKIIDNCQARPEGQTVKQWLAEQGIQEKNYYYWLNIPGPVEPSVRRQRATLPGA